MIMNTKESNKLIGEFMGAKLVKELEVGEEYIDEAWLLNDNFYKDLFYDRKWDWLMPVIYKIKDLVGLFPDDDEDSPELEEAMDKFEELFLDNNPVMESIEAANEAVVEFINWYNEEK